MAKTNNVFKQVQIFILYQRLDENAT